MAGNPAKVKVRVAPSPTGFLHIGTAQSALYNWLFAKKMAGTFYLRIEDTDKERSTKEFEQDIIDGLTWLGLDWEGDVIRTSDHLQNYRAPLEKLLREGKAFYCHHSQEELEAERQRQESEKVPPRHECRHKELPLGKEGGGIIRLAVDAASDRKIVFNDVIRGPIEFKAALLGDFSIARSVSDPLYNFYVIIDDAEMEISHIIRGEDHISNTPKQILIYEALGLPVPLFAHLPLILAPDRSKLSKRHGAMSVMEYKKDYLSGSLINFLGGLGYTFSKDILSREEMTAEFDLAKVHKSGAVFDIKKLNWINAQYVKRLSPADLRQAAGLPDISDAAAPLVTERLEKLSDAREFSYLWSEPEYEADMLGWKNEDAHITRTALERVKGVIENWDFQDEKILRGRLDSVAGGDRGGVYWPFRVALSGKKFSPDPVQIMLVLGKDEVIKRINIAISKLS